MRIALRNVWLQKHPTPSGQGGDFHWHPGDVPLAITSALGELLTRCAGQRASLWLFDPGFVAWARTFSATSPDDQRRYTGLVATIAHPVERDAAFAGLVPDLLEHLSPPAAGVFPGTGDAVQTESIDGVLSVWPVSGAELGHRFTAPAARRALARALLRGGSASCTDPLDPELPRLFGQLLSWLPTGERLRARRGLFVERSDDAAGNRDAPLSVLCHYLSRVWFCPEPVVARDPLYPSRAWNLVLELAAATSTELEVLFERLQRLASSWDSPVDLLAMLRAAGVPTELVRAASGAVAPAPLLGDAVADAGQLWNRLLHYWGRGFLTMSDSQLDLLVEVLAMRIVADHLFYLDDNERPALPERYLRRLRYEAILPPTRTEALTARLGHLVPSLTKSILEAA